MWIDLWLAVFATTALLYVPGYLFFRALRFSGILAACCAPLYSAACYASLPIAFYAWGIPCNTASILIPTCVLAVLAFAASRPWRHASTKTLTPDPIEPIRAGKLTLPCDVVMPLLYVTAGLIICSFVFLRNLPNPGWFFSGYDNQTHFNTIRAFLDSGKWSSLHCSSYLAAPVNAIPTGTDQGSFYPCGLYCLVALVCDAMKLEVMVGLNTCLVTICAIVLPLSIYAFLRALLPPQRGMLLCGIVATFCFPNWPWNCLQSGPLYPNLYGLSLMPAAIAWVVTLFGAHRIRRFVPSLLVSTALTFLSLGLAHPNTLFSLYVFMVPFGASVIGKAISTTPRISSTRLRTVLKVLLITLYYAATVGAWIALHYVPALNGVVGYITNDLASRIELANPLASLASTLMSHKRYLIIAILCILGCMPLRKLPNWKVIVAPVAFFVLANIALQCGWKHAIYWTSAFWYSDNRRIAHNLALYATPIVAYLLNWAIQLPTQILASTRKNSTGKHMRTDSQHSRRIVIARVCSFALVVGIGTALFTFGLRRAERVMHQRYEPSTNHIYSYWESNFVDKALEITGSSLVINQPHDGSVWSYGVNSMNTYYRHGSIANHTWTAKLIRRRLSDIETDKEVQQAVMSTGAEYVLLLDKGVAYEDGAWLIQLYGMKTKERWDGINRIDDDTPGFELVLAEGDEMRLYRIVNDESAGKTTKTND